MDIFDLVKDTGYTPKKKASSHGGEYCSPCPFCKEGDDRFLTWPSRPNKNGEFRGGRFSCRVCEKYGDAISFLRQLYGMSYQQACDQLKMEPIKRSGNRRVTKPVLPPTATAPPDLWVEKASAFIEWANEQLRCNTEGMKLLKARGFTEESIATFKLGFNPEKKLFRERSLWGLERQLKEDGSPRKIWLPKGIVIPSFRDGKIDKVKIRRSDWKEGDEFPKYFEVPGSRSAPSIFGNTSLPCIVLESELDALLIQQEAGDLIFCIALGGSTKPIDLDTEKLILASDKVFFLPDFDKAGASAWQKWKRRFPKIERILTPHEKSAGDYFENDGDLRVWIEESLKRVRGR